MINGNAPSADRSGRTVVIQPRPAPWPSVVVGYGNERRHIFEQANGSMAQCGGARRCRECIKEAEARK